MTDFEPCASPSCTACQEVRRLRELLRELRPALQCNGDPCGCGLCPEDQR